MKVAPAPLPLTATAPRTGGTRPLLQQLGPLAVVALAVADLVRSRWLDAPGEGFRFAPMGLGASLAFVLLSATLGFKLFRRAHPAWRILASGFCVLVGLMALRPIASQAFGAALGFEPTWLLRLAGSGGRLLSSQTGALLVITTFSFVALLSPLSARQRWRDGGIAAALAVQLFAIVAAISYTAGNPLASVDAWLRVLPHELAGIVALNALLLLQARATNRLRQWFFGSEVGAEPEDMPLPPDEKRAIALLAVAGGLALTASVAYLRVQTHRQQQQALETIQTLSDLKARQVVTWRRDRLAEARAIAKLPLLLEVITGAFDARGIAAARPRLEPWLAALRSNNLFSAAFILDRNLQTVAGAPRSKVIPSEVKERLAALHLATDVIELPPYVDEAGALHWDLLVPLRTEMNSALQGAIWLQTAPGNHITSQLSWWPDNFDTGQTVLWFRDGDRLTSLGGLKESSAVTANQAQPFGSTRLLSELPAYSLLGRSLRGEVALGEGLDHRGQSILGTTNIIRDSTWFLTSRVEAREVYATLRRDAWLVAGLLIGLLGTSGAATSWLWRQRQRNLVHDRVVAELEQKRLATRLGMVMRHANDMIFLTDENRRVVDANQVAVDTYGWTKEELLRLSTKDIRAPEALGTLAADAKLADTKEGAVYETVHRRKDGTTFPVEISVRQVELEGEHQVLSIIRDITERKKAAAALEKAHAHLQERVKELRCLYAISKLLAESDRPIGELLTAAAEIIPSGWRHSEVARTRITFQDRTHVSAGFVPTEWMQSADIVIAGKSVGSVDVCYLEQRSSFTTSPFMTDEQTLLNNIASQFSVMIERRHAEEKLRRLSSIIEQAPLSVVIINQAHTIEYVNPKLCAVMGYTKEEALGRNIWEFGTEELQPEVYPGLRRAVDANEVWTGELRSRKKNGEIFLENIVTAPLVDEHGVATHYVALKDDITAQKRFVAETTAMLAKERELSEMKSQFVSVASHEFRTPLAAATGSLELLERHAAKLTEAKRVELLARAQRSLGRLTEIMNNVLQLSRADSGRVKVKRMAVDLVQIVQDLIREVEAGDRSQHGFVFLPSGKGDAVPVDTNLFNHILSNLLGNAVRYSPAGTTIAVTLEVGEEGFVLTIADEGIGIPEAERDRVFEPFARGSNVGQIGGTGLGLNIVKRYVELMGGRIELLPSTRGACFRVSLPLQQPAA